MTRFLSVVTVLSIIWERLYEIILSYSLTNLVESILSLNPRLHILILILVIMISEFLRYRKKLEENVAKIPNFNQLLEELHEVLRDTEPTNPESQEWLDDAEDLAYGIEDLLVEFDYEMTQQQRAKCLWKRVLLMVLRPNYYKLSNEYKAIMVQMEEVNKRKEKLSPFMRKTKFPVRSIEGPISIAPSLYGRESEKQRILDFILSPNYGNQRFDIISIVGVGGLGKTALAQRVFNNDNVTTSFDVRFWYRAGMNFDRRRIFESMLEGSYDTHDLCSLEAKLHEKLTDKKFIVVLDDLWSESTLELNRFWAPFMDAAPNSKFIITTRDANIGCCIRMTERVVELPLLSEDDCWSVFLQYSRLQTDIDSGSELVNIGKEISKKCAGLPLAAMVIGGLLRGIDNEGEWRSVLNDKCWKFSQGKCEISSVLKLSYNRLPYYLKRCFAFCTVFREDYIFYREYVVRFWMTAGLIKCGRDGKDRKDVGGGYFDELVSRCFLLYKGDGQYVMHDLIREMGQEMCGDRYYAESQNKSSISWDKARHVALNSSKLMDCVEFERNKVIPLRSLILRNRDADIQKGLDQTLCLKLRKLRTLSFRNPKITRISNCLGELKHLRNLCIDCEKLTELPLDIWGLSKLLVLIICNCPLLTELPSEIGSLSSLLMLYIQNCPTLSKLPSEIGLLRNLSTFEIRQCPGLIELPSEMGSLSSLCELNIQDCQGMTKLPSQMGSLSSLCELDIWNCPGLTELPLEIGSLSSLSTLEIKNCPGLTELPSDIGSLSSLSTLDIWNCPGLTKLPPQIWRLSSLSRLQIVACIGLSALGLEMESLSSLSKLALAGIPKLIRLPKEIGNLSSLHTLVLSNLIVDELPQEITNLTSLSTLLIECLPLLIELPKEIGRLSSLSALYIIDCPKLVELPEAIEALSNLSTIFIDNCPGLAGVHSYGKSIKTEDYCFRTIWD